MLFPPWDPRKRVSDYGFLEHISLLPIQFPGSTFYLRQSCLMLNEQVEQDHHWPLPFPFQEPKEDMKH
ncbi:hypothetical protein X975_20996, partial [Stegodyphus mimosarum]